MVLCSTKVGLDNSLYVRGHLLVKIWLAFHKNLFMCLCVSVVISFKDFLCSLFGVLYYLKSLLVEKA